MSSNSVDDQVKTIRAALRQLTGRTWSVTRGTGTAYCYLTITAPPARREGHLMTEQDAAALYAAIGRQRYARKGITGEDLALDRGSMMFTPDMVRDLVAKLARKTDPDDFLSTATAGTVDLDTCEACQ